MSRRSAERLARAERGTQIARDDLAATLDELQDQLSPANLVNEAVQEVRLRGRGLADMVLMQILSRPVATTVAASLLGMVFRGRPGLSFLLDLILRNRATSRRPKHS